MITSKGYDFDDILLVPKTTDIDSRDEVDLSVQLPNHSSLAFPIFASPMKGIVGLNFIKEFNRLGGLGILHRFYNDPVIRATDILSLRDDGYEFGVAVGLDDQDIYKFALDNGAAIICVDVANGYTFRLHRICDELKNYIINNNYSALLMAGNVVTPQGVESLVNCGVTFIRVGIGSGKLCTTRNNTGVGYPQLTAIHECANSITGGVYLIADGGIRNSGDAVKALASGADFIMIGSLFSRTFESDNNGSIYGMASRKLQEEHYGIVKSVEGIELESKKDTSLLDFLTEFVQNMKSGFAYLNARNIEDLWANSTFVEVNKGTIKEI